jgi:formylglycine-generating enzyme required for sulfatase activity
MMKMRLRVDTYRIAVCVLGLWRTLAVRGAAPLIKSLVLAGGTSHLTIQSDVGSTNQIQYKTDLAQASWTVVTNIVVPQSPYVFVDAASPPSPRRFYRVAALGPGPSGPAAPLIKSLVLVGGTPRLTIQSDVGSTNQIQYKTDLAQASWTVITNIVVPQSPYVFVDVVSPPSPRRFYRVAALGAGHSGPSGMVMIPAGSFIMGDANDGNADGDAPMHSVTLSQFHMDMNLVSFDLWQRVAQWATNNGYGFESIVAGKGAAHPAQTMDWYDAVKWCNARSEMEGLTPCYYTDPSQTTVYRDGVIDLGTNYVRWGANGYRLPTEAEWEKAARGGSAGHRFPWGDTISQSQANYNSHPSFYAYDLGPEGYNAAYATGGFPYTSPLGSFAPNGYGLYDVAGNVCEWCWDWYSSIYYTSSPPTDPHGPATSAFNYRVLRGGAWDFLADLARCQKRTYLTPSNATTSFGFRCVRAF